MLTAEQLHRSFLDHLFRACRGAVNPTATAIRLVARAQDPVRLGAIGSHWLTLFVPDLHLFSKVAQQQFRYGFGQLRSGAPVARAALLRSVLQAGNAFFAENRVHASIATYQLGDFLDLWREGQFEDGVTIPILARRVREDYPWLFPLLLAKDRASLVADIVEGNHDRGLDTVIARARRAHAPSFGHADGRTPVLITHGDVTDPVEELRDAVAAYFLRRFGKDREGGSYPAVVPGVPLAPGASAPVTLSDADFSGMPPGVNLGHVALDASEDATATAHEQLTGKPPGNVPEFLLPKVTGWKAGVPQLRAGQGALFQKLNRAGNLPPRLPGLRLVVVGHSHHPRIVSVGEPDQPDSFLLMDCGAWIEELRWPDAGRSITLPSCQIGVLCGEDARIYQLDPAG